VLLVALPSPPVPPEPLLVALVLASPPAPVALLVVLPVVLLVVPEASHVPAVHVPCGQGVPSGLAALEHVPLAGSHVPAS
jgi:hypothetical protein